MSDVSDLNYDSGQSAIRNARSPALFLHCAIFALDKRAAKGKMRVLGDETFRLVDFQGQESVSETFEYELELHGNTLSRHDLPLYGGLKHPSGQSVQDKIIEPLPFDDVIGRPVTVGIQCQPAIPYTQSEMAERFQNAVKGGSCGEELSLFNGIVTAFSMEIPGVYRLSMKPALWKLTLTNRYAIHHQKNILTAITDLLDLHHIAYSIDAIKNDKDNLAVARTQDWLQAGETDMEFLRRLMVKAHLHYFFTHTGTGHRMVLVNRPGYPYPAVLANNRPLRYTYTGMDELGMAQGDVISQYRYRRSLVPSSVCSVFTRQEAAWENDPVATFHSYSAASQDHPGELPFHQHKIYQYGFSKLEAEDFTNVTNQSRKTSANQFSGSSYCAHFRVGHQFGITGKLMADNKLMPVQASLEGKTFVLTHVKHEANADGSYHNEFESCEAAGFITPFSIQETQQGAVLAKVVDSAGNKPPQDWRYYTANYFDPEQETLRDTDAAQSDLRAQGVYVRFSTAPEQSQPVWIKLAAHMQTVPEIGVTVLVSRAQDESELPEIQSIVHANGSLVVMPSTWTANTHVGSSYSTNYGDGQSIRYGRNSNADLPHAISIVDTSYQTGQYRDTGFLQGASYNFSCAESEAGRLPDHGELFGPYKQEGAADLLSASESFGSTYNRQYATVSSSFSQVGTSYNKSTIGKSKSYATISGTSDSETTHGGDITSVTTINANSTTTTKQTGTSTNTATYDGAMTSKTTHNDSVTNYTKIKGNNKTTTIQNTVVNLATTVAQTSSTATGASNSNDVVGVSNRNSATGASVDINVVGISNRNSAIGASVDYNVIGTTSTVSMIGNSNAINMTGIDNRITLTGTGYAFDNKAVNPNVTVVNLHLTLIDVLKIYL